MSLKPEITPTPEAFPPPIATTPATRQAGSWRRRLWIVLFALFAFEIGSFLLVFPWMDAWSLNHLPSLFPFYQVDLQDLWDEPYFRAAISSLGVLNLYIAFRDLVHLLRRPVKN